MNFKHAVPTGAAMSLVFSLVLPASGSSVWEPDVDAINASGFNVDYTQGRDLLYVQEEGGTGGTAVVAEASTSKGRFICEDLGVNNDCDTGEKINIGGQATLPICAVVIENCIESLAVSAGESDFLPSTYKGTTDGTKFRGNPAIGIPSGTGPTIFESAVSNLETNEYTVQATMGFWWATRGGSDFYFDANELSLRIWGSKSTSRPGATPAVAEIVPLTPDNKENSLGISAIQGCVYQDVGVCGVEVGFAPSTSFRVSLILTNQLAGWFRGRMKDPNITVEAVNSAYSRVTIDGEPVEVPRFLSTHSLSNGDPDIVGPLEDNGHGGAFTLFEAATERAMEIVNGMRSKVNDTAAGISSIWSMNSISGQRAAGNNSVEQKCLESGSKLLGIITTNAMTYTGTIPDFNSGFLSYKVAGLHYQPDGQTLNIGTYDLVMRSETARCLYGFSKAPVSATVAVVGEMGNENIATTIVSEKDGWLKLAAYGFTFSEKEIQVKLSQTFTKTMTKFSGSTKFLSSKQKAEIKASVTKAKSNPKFICTGTYVKSSNKATALARARAACSYAKSLDKNHSYFAQAKQTKAASYDAKVMLISK